MNAREHFVWSRQRAMEYAEMDDAANALSSLVSDLNKHEGTRGIMHPELVRLAVGEVIISGTAGIRHFIEGLPEPGVAEVQP